MTLEIIQHLYHGCPYNYRPNEKQDPLCIHTVLQGMNHQAGKL